MLESLVKKFNGVYLKSAYVIPEYTIEEVKSELGQYGIVIDENKHFRMGRVPTRPIHKNCVAIFVWTRSACPYVDRCRKVVSCVRIRKMYDSRDTEY